MRIVCSWCGKDQGEKEPVRDRSVTHTICPACLEDQKVEAEKFWDEFRPAAVSAAG